MVAYAWRSLEVEKSARVDLRRRDSRLEQFAVSLNTSFCVQVAALFHGRAQPLMRANGSMSK